MTFNTKRENITIKNKVEAGFLAAWHAFFKDYPQYHFYYQLPIIEYYKLLSRDVNDQSFILLDSDNPIAICVLIFENVNGTMQASMSNGSYLPTPLFHKELSEKQLRSLEEFLLEEIKDRLAKFKVNRLFVKYDVLSVGIEQLEDQMFSRLGGLDVSSYHHIIDLELPDEVIWEQFRHSSKSIINRGLKTYEFKVYDKSNYTDTIGVRHRLLHHKTAGRITRPILTFEKMYSWVEEGCGLMFEQLLNDQVVQMIFVALGKKTAVGASAADDPDIDIVVPMTHSMNYFIFQETKRRGIRYYDLGETAFRSNMFSLFTEKELKINYFKRGFSTRSYPLKKHVWFINTEEEVKYLNERMMQYEEYLQEIINK